MISERRTANTPRNRKVSLESKVIMPEVKKNTSPARSFSPLSLSLSLNLPNSLSLSLSLSIFRSLFRSLARSLSPPLSPSLSPSLSFSLPLPLARRDGGGRVSGEEGRYGGGHVGSANRIFHSPRSPREGGSGDTTPCWMIGVTLHSHVRYEELQARTCCGFLSSSVKPYSCTMSMCVSIARAEPFRQTLTVLHGATTAAG